MSLKVALRARVAQVLASPVFDRLQTIRRRLANHRAGRPPELHFFYDFSDPYNALAIPVAVELTAGFRVAAKFHPLIPESDDPAALAALRRAYSRRDARRECERRGLPPLTGTPPEDAIHCRLLAVGPALGNQPAHQRWMLAACEAIWREGIDLGADGAVETLLERTGLDPGVWSRTRGGTALEALAANRVLVKRLKHWGTPLWAIDGKQFYGIDRHEFLLESLAPYAESGR